MAWEENVTFSRRSFLATADLSAKQYFAFVIGSVPTAAKAIDGILQDNPASGQVGAIAFSGSTKAAISASQTITAGTTMLEVDTGGTLKPVASGIVVAKALESLTSVAAVRFVAVQLLPSNALHA